MAQFMFLISSINYMFLLWLLAETAYDSNTGLIWSPSQCLQKAQNLLQGAYLRVYINPHKKLAKMTMVFLWNICDGNAKTCYLFAPHCQWLQKNMVNKSDLSSKMCDTAKISTAQKTHTHILWHCLHIHTWNGKTIIYIRSFKCYLITNQ